MSEDDSLTLTVNGRVYEGWTEAHVTRSLEQCASVFELEVTERWAGRDGSWQIKSFDTAVISLGADKVMTGYVEEYLPAYDGNTHSVRITGRSKTCDLVDCMPEIKGGQFNGYTIDKIARALCAPFGIEVVVEADVGAPMPDATIDKCETAHAFLEKLCRVRGILACDDADGRLVLTSVGTASASGALIEGQNIKTASGRLTANQRFQKYIVLSQAPLGYDGEDAHLDTIGTATDSGCPRYRRFAEMAETPGDAAIAALRARWRAARNYGQSTQATLGVQGWRQPDGTLWPVNQLVPVQSPMLAINRPLLIGAVTYSLGEEGRLTTLTVMPPQAYQPAPDSKKKHKGTADNWEGY